LLDKQKRTKNIYFILSIRALYRVLSLIFPKAGSDSTAFRESNPWFMAAERASTDSFDLPGPVAEEARQVVHFEIIHITCAGQAII
jgi:hypothetical protein